MIGSPFTEWKFLAHVVVIVPIIGLSVYGTWYVTSDHYQKVIAEQQVKEDEAARQQLEHLRLLATEHAEKSRQAEEQHAADEITITRLGNQLAGVRIHIPSVSCGAVSGTSQTAADSNGTSGMAAARIDEYLAEAQRAIQDIGQRCAQINIDAIKANAQH